MARPMAPCNLRALPDASMCAAAALAGALAAAATHRSGPGAAGPRGVLARVRRLRVCADPEKPPRPVRSGVSHPAPPPAPSSLTSAPR